MVEGPEKVKEREMMRYVTGDELRELIQSLPDGTMLEIRLGGEDGHGG